MCCNACCFNTGQSLLQPLVAIGEYQQWLQTATLVEVFSIDNPADTAQCLLCCDPAQELVKHLSGGDDLDLVVFAGHHNAAMRLQVEVLLASHLAGALNDVVTLPRLEALVHIATVYPVAPALQHHSNLTAGTMRYWVDLFL